MSFWDLLVKYTFCAKNTLFGVAKYTFVIWEVGRSANSTASESRETESRLEALSHGYWIHQLDTRKTAYYFTYVWPTLLRKLNHKYESFCANIMNISCFSHHINLRMCWWKFTIAITLGLYITTLPMFRIDNVIHHLRNKMRRERFCTIKGIQHYGCAYKSEINHWCSAFSLL